MDATGPLGALRVAQLLIAFWVVAQGLLLLLQSFEHRRFARRRRAKPVDLVAELPVVLVAPLKGFDIGLAENVRSLFRQRYPWLEVRGVVESERDPAAEIFRSVAHEFPAVRSRLVVAGLATDSGQKVHNLMGATAELSPETRVLAFVDSDARPGHDWLRCLVARLEREEAGAVTSYRWFVPQRATWTNSVVASINASVAALLGPGGHYLVWGGSWAIRRETFDAIDLRGDWNATLSDDLVASRVLRQAGRRVEFEPASMVASSIDLNARQAAEFVRRQYLIGRHYTPRWWLATLAVSTLWQIAFWGGIVAALTRGKNDFLTVLPFTSSATLYAIQIARSWLRSELAKGLATDSLATRHAAWVDRWGGPIVGTCNWLALVASAFGHTLTWRGIRYRLAPGGRVIAIERGDSVPPQATTESIPSPHFAASRTSARGYRSGRRAG